MKCNKQVKMRGVTYKEFVQEKEHPHKFFQLSYIEWGNEDLPDHRVTKETQRKDIIRRWMSNPNAHDMKLTVMELVDNG